MARWFKGKNVTLNVHFNDVRVKEDANLAFVDCAVTFAAHKRNARPVDEQVHVLAEKNLLIRGSLLMSIPLCRLVPKQFRGCLDNFKAIGERSRGWKAFLLSTSIAY
jgi:hypothetical protein